jgi:hypothetical protein
MRADQTSDAYRIRDAYRLIDAVSPLAARVVDRELALRLRTWRRLRRR